MSRHLKKNGFTFIEMLTVLAILAVVAAITGPNITPLVESIQLRSTGNSIKYQLVLAKTRTLGDSRIHCGVFFDTGSTPQRVQTFFDNTTSGSKGYYDVGVDILYMEPFLLPPTISMKIGGAGTNRSIIFRGDGSSTVHGMELSITTKHNRKKIISVLPSTGRIKIITP